MLNPRIECGSQYDTDLQVSPPNQTSVSVLQSIRHQILITYPSGIHHYAPGPPRSLTASLGREIEKFDQLCDALESRLVRVFLISHSMGILTK